jgi:hypothetical protein
VKHKIYLWAPLAVLLIGFLFIMNSLIQQSKSANDGIFIYALDDPYIHMAIARSVVETGVWGVTPDNFSSSSSSLLWPSLLAFVFLFTEPVDTIPLILNLFFACLCIVITYWVAIKNEVPPWISVLITGVVAFIAPFPALILSGMEHILHFGLTILFMYILVEVLQSQEMHWKKVALLGICTLFLVTVRYEGLFLVGIALAFLIIRKLFTPAIITALTAFTPLAGYGFWSNAQGWFFLPNPLLLKGNFPHNSNLSEIFSNLIEFGMGRFDRMPEITWLLIFGILFLLFYFVVKPQGYQQLAWMMGCFLGMLIPHTLFAGFGWFFRYEMYLVGIAVFLQFSIIGIMLVLNWRERPAWLSIIYAGIAVVVVWYNLTLFSPRFNSIESVVQATTNIYEQQYQMARFLREHYQDIPVAVNDIGAVAYYTEVELIDLWGLAERDVAWHWINGSYNTQVIDSITQRKGVEIALVYDAWFQGEMTLPDSWIRVGQWSIRNNVVCGDDTVSIYGTNLQSARNLILALKSFSNQLPDRIIESGSYLKADP